MDIHVLPNKEEMGKAAAEKAASILREALAEKDTVRFIVATGASQFEFLKYLAREEGIDWGRTEMFHLDEYVAMPETHPASFRKYLKERLIGVVHPGKWHLIDGEAADPQAECERVGALLQEAPIDVAFVGIGENGHLAFNDPPADFETKTPFLVVDLDEKCRRQQLGEGWFDSLEDVPTQAISMSVSAIVASRNILCTVPDERKAQAVADCLSAGAPVSNLHPASILKEHENCFVYLDESAASLLGK